MKNPKTGAPWRLLLVDDDSLIVELMTARVRAAGFDVASALNGRQAKELLDRQPYDLVICDVVMPEVDGLTLCRQLREAGNKVPFLFLTAKGQPRDIVELLATGADDYLVKPFDAGELLARVNALLRRLHTST